MMSNGKEKSKSNFDLKDIDVGVLGQIMAAQNIVFVLPTKKNIAEFFAKSLYAIPGVSACRVCLGSSFSQEGNLNNEVCNECKNKMIEDENHTFPKNFVCKVNELPNTYVFALETAYYRFGFFIFSIEQSELFELYKPFISNLGNFIALSLENRLQKSDLQKAQEVLEDRVLDRTIELQTANALLEEEVEARENTEKVLQESEEQFRFLFETMAQGVVIQDSESRILNANNAACEILGLSMDQLLGKTAYDPRWKLIHEDGSPLYREEMPSNVALRTCKPVTNIFMGTYIPEQNIYHWILAGATPKFKEGDNIPYITMTTFSNITERKQAEKQIRKLNEELEQRVNERTVELKHANERLQELDRLKSMFIASMSHELRTPLNSIIGFSSILLNGWAGTVSPEQKENLATILKAGKHLLSLINDVIDVSKIEAENIESFPEEFDLSDVVNEAAGAFESSMNKKEIEVRISQTHQLVYTDRRRLLQCLYNLISNAVKYTEKGEIDIHVGIYQDREAVEISVTDTGIGIKEEEINVLFSAFKRLDSSLRSTVPGTGLGLYLTKKIAKEIIKGYISVSSVYGKGSRFALTIPLTGLKQNNN